MYWFNRFNEATVNDLKTKFVTWISKSCSDGKNQPEISETSDKGNNKNAKIKYDDKGKNIHQLAIESHGKSLERETIMFE